METLMNSSFDWTGIRQPYIVATENDSLNGVVMLFGHLLSNTAQVFADVRTYWSPEAVKRVTGYVMEGNAANGVIHLINSGSASLDGTGEQSIDGEPVMKPWWDVTPEEAKNALMPYGGVPRTQGISAAAVSQPTFCHAAECLLQCQE